ncbi:hypothetical protein, partial [Bradyrhizobium denitrificans]|uniref:hypothetical protein n=1 Tax=Bradyrhizobium denitrificans TaxID=2734912 RepID=UPI001AEDAB03
MKDLDPLPLSLLRSAARRTVPVVQQCREQRRRGRHPAAALCQRQRCMLVTQQLRKMPLHLAHARRNALLANL